MILSATVKRQITSDWAQLFSEMTIFKPMWLLRRIDPIVVGIILERDTGNNCYRPTSHLHNLSLPSDFISLGLCTRAETQRGGPLVVRADHHAQHYHEAAALITKQSLVPLRGEIHLSQLVNAYSMYLKTPLMKFSLSTRIDLLCILSFCGQKKTAEEWLSRFAWESARWPLDIFDHSRERDEWLAVCSRVIHDPQRLHLTIREQIVALGLDAIPCSGHLL